MERGWLSSEAQCHLPCSALSPSRWTTSKPSCAGSLWSTWRTSRSSMSAGGGRYVRASGLGDGAVGGPGGSWFPPGLCRHSHLPISFLSLPQLSFSIVSLCNHLTRSLMKKVHLRPDENLVGKCRALFWDGILYWPGAQG